MDKLQLEDTVSADRKERIIFDPEAWRKSDKSGRKTSAITSRQNFDNEKFTRKAKSDEEKVEESVIQPNDTSKVEAGGPEQSDTISKDKQKKSNSPQIEFVTGTATPNGSSSTAIGNQQMSGRKLAEALVEKAIKQVKGDSNIPFDGPYTKTPDTVVDKSGAKHTAYSRVRDLARKALVAQSTKKTVKEDIEQIDEIRRDDAYTRDYKSSISGMGKRQSAAYHADGGANDEGWDDEPSHRSSSSNTPHSVHINGKKWKTFGSHSHATNVAKKIKGATVHKEEFEQNQSVKLKQEETTMSKTYTEFMEELQESGYTVRKIEGTRYGGSKQTTHPEHDEDDEDSKPAEPVKRGRGRPAGSKSGANLKVTKGKSYGGIATHSLNLPNSNR